MTNRPMACRSRLTRLSFAASLRAAVVMLAARVSPAEDLKPSSAFTDIADPAARSVAVFTEAARVIQHPRCLNCHPADRTPTQGDDLHRHLPWIPPATVGARSRRSTSTWRWTRSSDGRGIRDSGATPPPERKRCSAS